MRIVLNQMAVELCALYSIVAMQNANANLLVYSYLSTRLLTNYKP